MPKTKISKKAEIELSRKELTKLIENNLAQLTDDEEVLKYKVTFVSENIETEYDGYGDMGTDVFKGITIHLEG